MSADKVVILMMGYKVSKIKTEKAIEAIRKILVSKWLETNKERILCLIPELEKVGITQHVHIRVPGKKALQMVEYNPKIFEVLYDQNFDILFADQPVDSAYLNVSVKFQVKP